jgi:hypothetical protein
MFGRPPFRIAAPLCCALLAFSTGPASAQSAPDFEDVARRVLAEGGYGTKLEDGRPPSPPPSEKAPRNPPEFDRRSGSSNTPAGASLAFAGEAVLWVLVAVVVAAAIAALVKAVARRGRTAAGGAAAKGRAPTVATSAPDAQPSDPRSAEALAAAGDFAGALRALFLRLLRAAYGGSAPPPALTERRAAAAARGPESIPLRAVARVLERVRYAGAPADAAAWREAEASTRGAARDGGAA